jgi:hypothetical protein
LPPPSLVLLHVHQQRAHCALAILGPEHYVVQVLGSIILSHVITRCSLLRSSIHWMRSLINTTHISSNAQLAKVTFVAHCVSWLCIALLRPPHIGTFAETELTRLDDDVTMFAQHRMHSSAQRHLRVTLLRSLEDVLDHSP